MKRKRPSKEILENLYLSQKLAVNEIAKRYETDRTTVSGWITFYGIERHVLVRPSKEEMEDLYLSQKISPEDLAIRYNCSGRTIRNWLDEYGIPRLGPAHLRKNKSATWSIGVKRSEETREKNRIAHLGKIPYNKGYGSISFVCEVCGKEVFDKPYRRKRTCSKECTYQLSHIYRGEEHWNYKGDNAGFVQRKRNWSQYREWRTNVFELANYTCVCCGQHGGRLAAHHLYTWNNYPEKRFDPNNGVCLCWKCHWAFHCECSHYDTTPEMFTEWLATKLK